jgi:hypothetical protein
LLETYLEGRHWLELYLEGRHLLGRHVVRYLLA